MFVSRLAAALLTARIVFACAAPRLAPSPDYKFLIASVADGETAGAYRWLRNGELLRAGRIDQRFLLQGDEHLKSAEGAVPLISNRVSFEKSRWGAAFFVEPGGELAYPREGYLDLEEGAIEMWIALREDGDSAGYAKDTTLLRYSAANGEYLQVSQAGRDGVLYIGGAVRGQWQSAYGGRASMRSWKAGAWHHIAATFSTSGDSMRFYVDGVKTADTNEHHYWPAASNGDRFTLGAAGYLIDAVRLSARALDEQEIRASAARVEAPRHGEAWLPLAGTAAGDSLIFEAGECASAAFVYQGIPVGDAQPASTLLPPGTTELDLSVRSAVPTTCRYAVNSAAAFDSMTPFESGAGGTVHRTRIAGLSPDARLTNEVFVRCASAPDYVMKLLYRSLGRVNPRFPRIGNLWGSANMLRKGHEYAARISGYFGAEMQPADIRKLRELNPEIAILTSINTMENSGLPDDYYLKDTNGNKIEVWPGTYRLNLTKPYVAEYQAKWAYQKMLDSELLYDGVFFDNFFTTQAWLKADIHGTALQLDANEDGKPDDPVWLDAEWRKGVFYELAIWRGLMPHALAQGHLPRPVPPEIGEIFNGGGILFASTNVLDGKASFDDFQDSYQRWWELGRQPVIAAIESSPPNQIAYGYGYSPFRDGPAATIEFGRTLYRYMRFGLATALMNDGYFWHDFGDIVHGVDWPYDEYAFDLGYPLGPAQSTSVNPSHPPNPLRNASFEEPLAGTWNLSVSGGTGAAAELSRDTDAADGNYSALIQITNAGQGVAWHIDFNQRDQSFEKGKSYGLSFWAKSDAPREIQLASQKGTPDWRNYGLSRSVAIGAEWKLYRVVFDANETANDARIQFQLGAAAGKVWLDGVRLEEQAGYVYRRSFSGGEVLLNGTPNRQRVVLGEGYSHFAGEQAPKHQYILDDDAPGVSFNGAWREAIFDTGQWKSRGPYYHNWGKACRKLEERNGTAEWNLAIPEDGIYTIEAWWAAAPEQSKWTRTAVYEVLDGGKVVASKTLDQSAAGDQWHAIAEVPLRAAGNPVVRLRNDGEGAAIADALYVWSAARYNDGAPVSEVTLEPYDGVLLRK
jgi:hypothetical protein